MINNIVSRYYDWLIDMIDFEDKTMLYETLLKHLFEVDFVWLESIDKDENRAQDGIDLRKNYFSLLTENDRVELTNLLNNKQCSMLEMFVAFAERLTQIVNLERYQFFWIFIDNLGLSWATEYDFDVNIVNDILYDFMHGTCHGNEPIGDQNPPVLFPCKEVYMNMDKDLYTQANMYLRSYFL